MTPDQIQYVRESFAKVAPIKAQAAALFYSRLFETAPQVRPMFPADLGPQGAKLMIALGLAVAGLERLEDIVPQLQHMARRHVDYGVKEGHYAVVGETLVWTLDKSLGADFTPQVRKAWIEAYGIVAEVMIAAARNVPERVLSAAA